MKELILLRHAKSSWESPLSDIDRPLMPKGIDRISAMTRSSISLFESVDEVYSSPANRALHTAVLVLRNAKLPLDILKVDQTTAEARSFDLAKTLIGERKIRDYPVFRFSVG